MYEDRADARRLARYSKMSLGRDIKFRGEAANLAASALICGTVLVGSALIVFASLAGSALVSAASQRPLPEPPDRRDMLGQLLSTPSLPRN